MKSSASNIIRSLRKSFAGLAFLVFLAAGQQALAQQGDACLACHTGLPATESNLITESVAGEPAAAACDYSNADMLFAGNPMQPCHLV